MSPCSTRCSRSVSPEDSTTTRIVPVSAGDECLVVRAVLFRFLRHEPDVGHAAHGRRIQGAVLLAVLDDGLVDGGVAAVGNHGLGVVQLAVRPPHLAAFAHDDRHGRVDDDVVRDVQVGDALVGVDHGQGRPGGIDGLDVILDLRLFVRREALDLGVDVAEPVVGVDPQPLEGVGVFGEHRLEEHGHGVAEHDRIGDLHHRGLQVQRQEQALRPSRPRSARQRMSAALSRSSPRRRGFRLR